MHDTKAFISKGFKDTGLLEIKISLGTTKSLIAIPLWINRIAKILLKKILKKSNSFWWRFKLSCKMGLFPRNKFMGE